MSNRVFLRRNMCRFCRPSRTDRSAVGYAAAHVYSPCRDADGGGTCNPPGAGAPAVRHADHERDAESRAPYIGKMAVNYVNCPGPAMSGEISLMAVKAWRGQVPLLPHTWHEAGLRPAAVHEGVVGVTACDRREPCRREHVRGVEEGAAEAVADEMLRIQRILAVIRPS